MKNFTVFCRGISGFTALFLSMVLSFSLWAQTAPPTIGQAFTPDLILQGETSTLSFEIAGLQPGVDAVFSSTLPAGLVVANPANAVSNCGIGVPDINNGRDEGVVVAVAGSSQISYTKAGFVPGDNCLVEVDVLSTAIGEFENGAVTLFYDGGTQQTLSNVATLTVEGGGTGQNPAPVFSKSFSPDVIGYGGRSTLTFTIDNSLGANVTLINFSDNLPDGMLVAEPANLTTTCPIGTATGSTSTLTAEAGSDVITYRSTQFAQLPAYDFSETVCTISVDVIVNATSEVTNISEELTTLPFGSQTEVSSGRAVASITANGGRLEMTAEFVGDPIYAGGSVDIVYVLNNTDRTYPATDVAFMDDLNAALSGLLIDSVLENNCDGLVALEPLGSESKIVYSGGTLAPESSCSISLSLLVPAAAPNGQYPNSTSEITGTSTVLVTTQIGVDDEGDPIFETTEVEVTITGMPAEDTLFVSPIPILTKTFQSDTVAAGSDIDLEFTITNTSPSSTATDIVFIDELTTFLPFPVGVTLPAAPCGSGSSVALVSLNTERQGLSLTDGELAASASCTFTVGVNVPVGMASGVYVNTTDVISATVDGETVTGAPASDSFAVIAPPTLAKEFTDDPVSAGDLVTLEFTLAHDEVAPGDATGIMFTDDLSAAVAGMAADDIDLPESDICGSGSSLSGTTTLTFSGGTLAADETCSFSVDVRVPALTDSGRYVNTTSAVMATVLGEPMLGQAASAELNVGGLLLSKVFIPAETLPGTSVDATYTITNISDSDASGIYVTDDLDDLLAGLVATPGILPLNDVCGVGSTLSLTGAGDLLTLTQGTVVAGGNCSFSASVDIPAGTPSAIYSSSTESFVYTLVSGTAEGSPATAELSVNSDFLSLSKEFIGDPVRPGETAILRFTMSNLHATEGISDVAFTDDLDAALSNLTALGLPLAVCGGTASTLSGAVIDFSGGALAAGTSCSFDVEVSVDPATPLGSVAFNETSTIDGTLLSIPVSGDAATDEMEVHFIDFSKRFAAPESVLAGGTIELSFTLSNASQTERVFDLSFSDDLDAMISGAVAVNLPIDGACGPGSQIDGTGLVTLQGASLLPAGSCTVTIEVEVPLATPAGDYTNITSALFWDGVASADAATAPLEILPPPDSDHDGVLDDVDICLGTVIPESVPTKSLKPNRYALVDNDTVFDVGSNGKSDKSDKSDKSEKTRKMSKARKSTKSGKSDKSDKGPVVFTTEDTGGCSCEQIIDAVGLGNGHTMHGCSLGAMRDWVELINSPSIQW